MTLKELSEKLNLSERTIKKYCQEFADFLDVDVETFDYLFTPEMVDKIGTIKSKLQKPTYALVKKRLEGDEDKKTGAIDQINTAQSSGLLALF